MGQMITKPDANPIVIAVANLISGGVLGYFLMGQKKKAITALIIAVVVFFISICTLGLGGMLYLYSWVLAYDGYLLGQKLQSGQSIGMNENGLDFLNAIFMD